MGVGADEVTLNAALQYKEYLGGASVHALHEVSTCTVKQVVPLTAATLPFPKLHLLFSEVRLERPLATVIITHSISRNRSTVKYIVDIAVLGTWNLANINA